MGTAISVVIQFDDLREGDNDMDLQKEGMEEAAVEQRQQLLHDYPNNNNINNNNDRKNGEVSYCHLPTIFN